jgi:DNA-binding MarR family transcriptional regulator
MIEKRRKEVSAAEFVAEECIAVRLRLLTRAVTRLYNNALRPHGLTVSQMNVLVAVCRMGEARPQAICHVLQLEKSTLSRDVERMLARGWLESMPGQDARTIRLKVTPAGERLVEKTIPAWKNAQRQAKALLRKQGIVSLQRAVVTIRSAESPITA